MTNSLTYLCAFGSEHFVPRTHVSFSMHAGYLKRFIHTCRSDENKGCQFLQILYAPFYRDGRFHILLLTCLCSSFPDNVCESFLSFYVLTFVFYSISFVIVGLVLSASVIFPSFYALFSVKASQIEGPS